MFSELAKADFRCREPDCGYRGGSKSDLRVHMYKHTRERPFACNLCDYRAYQTSKITRHKQSMHSDEDTRKKMEAGKIKKMFGGCDTVSVLWIYPTFRLAVSFGLLIGLPTVWLIGKWIDSLIHWKIDRLNDWSIDWLIDRLIDGNILSFCRGCCSLCPPWRCYFSSSRFVESERTYQISWPFRLI